MDSETVMQQSESNTVQPVIESSTEEEIVASTDAANETILDEDRNNSSLLNTTKTSGKRTLVASEKINSVNDDIASGKFTETRNFSKRTALQKRLPYEIFDSPTEPIFKHHKTGFVTERPLQWMMAMEKYVLNEDGVQARWTYKTDENGTIHESEISTWFQTTTEVTVTIIITTGVFIVQGQACRKFAESEFNKIRSRMEDSTIIPPNVNNAEPSVSDTDGIWSNIDANKNAIKGVEQSILKIFEIIKETEINKKSSEKNDSEILKLETMFDNKLTIFMEAYEEKMEEKIKRVCQSFDTKLGAMKTIVANFKISVQSQINDIRNNMNEPQPPKEQSPDLLKLESLEDNFRKYRTEFGLWKESSRISMMKLDARMNNISTTTEPPKETAQQQIDNKPEEKIQTEHDATPVENGTTNSTTPDDTIVNDGEEVRSQEEPGEPENGNIGTEDLELLVFMDSNNHHVDWDIFWRTRGVMKKIFKGSLWDVEGIVKADNRNRSVQYVLINVGVNDIDTKSVEEVSDQVKKVCDLIRTRYGNPKIILAEITPRMDEKDAQVIECNTLINEYIESTDYISVAKHSRLRTPDGKHYHDDKHITKYAVAIFCASLKRALRTAYGIQTNEFSSDRRYNNYRGRGGSFNNRGRQNNNRRGGRFDNRGGGRGRYRGGYHTREQESNFSSRAELEKLIRAIVVGINTS